jgi:tetratricopeptide (TPR) repeat protein
LTSDALRSSRAIDLWLSTLLVAATLGVYAGVATHDFVNFDDPGYTFANRWVEEGLSRAGAAWALASFEFFNWAPLTWLSHMADTSLFGMRPGPRLLENAVLHALAALALFAALRRATEAPGRSFAVAGLFALHPLHVESVAWLSSRKDVLSGLFWMLAMLAYVGWAQRGRRRDYALCLLCTALGLAAKSVLVTLPAALLLLDVWPLQRLRLPGAAAPPTAVPLRRLLGEKVPLGILSVAASILAWRAQRAGGSILDFEQVPLALRLANAVLSTWAYLGKTLWPVRLAAFYPFPTGLIASRPSQIALAAAAALLAAITLGAVAAVRRAPALTVGWLWYLIVLAPMVGIVQLGDHAMADRYSYLPLVGIFLATVWVAADLLAARRAPAWAAPALAAASLAACAAISVEQVRVWRDSLALFSHAIAVTAPNALAQNNLGVALKKAGRFDEAQACFVEAIRLRPTWSMPYNNLGTTLKAKARLPEAAARFSQAVALDPGSTMARENLASVLALLDRDREAIAEYREVVAREPDRASARLALADLLARTGLLEDAAEEYPAALALDPENVPALANYGLVLFRLGRSQEAIAPLEEALRRAPDRVEPRNTLAAVWLELGRPEDAVAQLRESERIDPTRGDTLYELARALLRIRRHADAVAVLSTLLRQHPDDAEARQLLDQVEAAPRGRETERSVP